jgi:para-nitrobenzyl esterase
MKRKTTLAFGALLLLLPALFFSSVTRSGALLTTVNTDAGTVAGTTDGDGDVVAFKGIPFAAPPVGDLRWKAPQPAPHWMGVKQCTAFGPSPMQSKPMPFSVWTSEFLIPEAPISEDCLYLNVWTNAHTKRDKKPVYVWIYGGGFVSGGSACPIYDGEAMAKKGVIFVSINYRVGVFGFYALPALSAESPDKVSGNYGLLDQVAALKWVQKNIAAFGGDPDNVTIGGQSAGSASVNDLVATPLTKGLFKKAIAESGSLVIKRSLMTSGTLAAAEQKGKEAAAAADEKSLADLRAMPAADVMKKITGRFGPVVDGYVLPESVADIFAKNKQNHVAIITGWNADDIVIPGAKNAASFKKQLARDYGADSASFLKYFPAGSDEEAARSSHDLNRDISFGASGYKWAQIQSEYGNSPAWVYRFERKVPGEGAHAKDGAFHTAEVPYALGDLKFVKRPLQPSDQELSKLMSAYWVNFIKTGDPNGAGLAPWPRFNSQQDVIMVFNEKSASVPVPDKSALDFLVRELGK